MTKADQKLSCVKGNGHWLLTTKGIQRNLWGDKTSVSSLWWSLYKCIYLSRPRKLHCLYYLGTVRHRHVYDCHEGRSLYSQFPRNRRQATIHQAIRSTRVGQEVEERRETCINKVWVLQERMGKAK